MASRIVGHSWESKVVFFWLWSMLYYLGIYFISWIVLIQLFLDFLASFFSERQKEANAEKFYRGRGLLVWPKKRKPASDCSQHDLISILFLLYHIHPIKFLNLAPFFTVKTFDVVLSVKKRNKIQNLTRPLGQSR